MTRDTHQNGMPQDYDAYHAMIDEACVRDRANQAVKDRLEANFAHPNDDYADHLAVLHRDICFLERAALETTKEQS